MIPAGVDIADLSAQLREDQLAIGPNAEFGRMQESELLDVLSVSNQESGSGVYGGADFGLALIDVPVGKAADLRDVAQELQLNTEIETIVVRTPTVGAAVSDFHSRAELEAAESAFAHVQTSTGFQNFVDELSGAPFPWGIIAIVLTIVIVTALTTSWLLVTKSLRN